MISDLGIKLCALSIHVLSCSGKIILEVQHKICKDLYLKMVEVGQSQWWTPNSRTSLHPTLVQ